MYTLDLQWVIFVILLVVTTMALVVLSIDRRRRHRQDILSAALDTFRATLERAPFGLLVLVGDHYRYANRFARRLLGLTEPAGPLPEQEWADQLRTDLAAARQSDDTSERYRNVTLTNDQVIRWWLTVDTDVAVVVALDITAQHRAQQTTRYLLSDLSHELRTPLSTIRTHLEVLRLPTIGEDVRDQSLAFLRDEAQRMSRMVENALALSRLETRAQADHRPVDLVGIVEEAVAQARMEAQPRDIQIAVEAGGPLPPVPGNPDQLKQVYLNLLDNSVKYSRPGDRVTVTLRRDTLGICCVVHDTGPGIPAEHLPHVTERFYRAVPSGVSGSGLGLALVSEILRQHQSTLEIESETKGDTTGTWARFTLPTADDG